MAQKEENKKVESAVREDSKRSTAGEAPFSDNNTNPDGRGVVGETVTTSFDERTGVTQPFITKDGKQDNGLANLDDVEGAKASSTRKGNNTTVEDTEEAIRRGFVPASDQPDRPEEPTKNPVK